MAEICVCRADVGNGYVWFWRAGPDAEPNFDPPAGPLSAILRAAYARAFGEVAPVALMLTSSRLSNVLADPEYVHSRIDSIVIHCPEGRPNTEGNWVTILHDLARDRFDVSPCWHASKLFGSMPSIDPAEVDRPTHVLREEWWRPTWKAIEFVPEVKRAYEDMLARDAKHTAWVVDNAKKQEKLKEAREPWRKR